jgi:phosphoribosylamine--glycine ligase
VIEEFLQGEEVSFIVIASDQASAARHLAGPQAPRRRRSRTQYRRHGRLLPRPLVTPALHARIMREVIEPTLRGLRDDGNPYLGFLYAG